MATSNTRTFDPQFAELLGEAFARINVQPRDITQEHIDQGVRSTNLTFIHFANRVQHQFQMAQLSVATVANQATYDLGAGVLDVFAMVHRRDGLDTPMWPISRSDYLTIPDKTNNGRPLDYVVERGKTGIIQRTVTVWPTPDRVDALVYWAVRKPEDVTGLPDNLGVAWEWFDAYSAELAKRMARKFAPSLVAELRVEAEEAFQIAKAADRERAPLRLRMVGYGRRGRRF